MEADITGSDSGLTVGADGRARDVDVRDEVPTPRDIPLRALYRIVEFAVASGECARNRGLLPARGTGPVVRPVTPAPFSRRETNEGKKGRSRWILRSRRSD